jgi:hypothetical protein
MGINKISDLSVYSIIELINISFKNAKYLKIIFLDLSRNNFNNFLYTELIY